MEQHFAHASPIDAQPASIPWLEELLDSLADDDSLLDDDSLEDVEDELLSDELLDDELLDDVVTLLLVVDELALLAVSPPASTGGMVASCGGGFDASGMYVRASMPQTSRHA